MDFKLQNLRDTAYNRQVCEDAVRSTARGTSAGR